MTVFIVLILNVLLIVSIYSFSFAKNGNTSFIPLSSSNVILVVVDCLRADHLSCYGYSRKTTPSIDAFASESVVFKTAVSQASNTALSFASIFTSQYVNTHGLTSIDKYLGDSALTLAQILNIYGYRTAAFVGGPLLNPVYRLDKGFEVYNYDAALNSSFTDTAPKALQWLKEQVARHQKFFLVLHGNDLHFPYRADLVSRYEDVSQRNQPFLSLDARNIFMIYNRKIILPGRESISLNDVDIKHIVDLYDEQVTRVDAAIGAFFANVKQLGLLSSTAIILIADHGEGLFDHEFFFHDHSLYENTLRVPLIIRMPGYKAVGCQQELPVQLIDLLPTILDMLSIPKNDLAQGQSILNLLTHRENTFIDSNRYAFSQTPHADISIRNNEWKLIKYPKITRLFNIKNDPAEMTDLAQQNPSQVAKLLEAYRFYFASRIAASDSVNTITSVDASDILLQNIKNRQADRQRIYDVFNKTGIGK